MEHILQHRDFGDYILEFCASHSRTGCDFEPKRIYGKKWEELFPFSNSD